jgi:hypothetical protein
MSQYIITIVPVVDGGFTGPATQTMVRVDLEGGQLSVMELTVRAAEGSSLGHGSMPQIDFELLMRAFLPSQGEPRVDRLETESMVGAVARHPMRAGGTASARARKTSPTRRGTPSSSSTDKISSLRRGRVYRRAPETAELEAAYLEAGSIAGVAEHFGVPVHTAQGWVSRMRRKSVESTEG